MILGRFRPCTNDKEARNKKATPQRLLRKSRRDVRFFLSRICGMNFNYCAATVGSGLCARGKKTEPAVHACRVDRIGEKEKWRYIDEWNEDDKTSSRARIYHVSGIIVRIRRKPNCSWTITWTTA